MTGRHLWITDKAAESAPTLPLLTFLRSCNTLYRPEGELWSGKLFVNGVLFGFTHMVIGETHNYAHTQEVARLIKQEAGRLRTAQNRLMLITPFLPPLTHAELQSASLSLFVN